MWQAASMLTKSPRISRRATMRVLLGGTVAALCVGLSTACRTAGPSTPTAPAATAAPIPVRAASLRTFAEAGQYIAADRGYFAEEGLDVTLSEMSARTVLTALIDRELDVGGSSIGAAIFSTVAQGVQVRIVAPEARMEPGSSSLFTLVNNDLIDAGQFRDYADLAGKRIVGSAGSTSQYFFWRALQRVGLSPDSVNMLDLGQDFQTVVAALGNHAVDVATVPEPIATMAAERGLATKWREVSDLLPGLQVTVVVFGPDLVTSRPEVGRRWMTAYLRGVRDYTDAIFKRGPHRDDVVAILAKWTGITDPSLYGKMGFPNLDPNGHINLDSVADQLSFHREQGNVPAAVELAQVVDTRIAEAAVQELGLYRL